MSTYDSPALSDLDGMELDILAELGSPEAVAAFEMLHAAVPVETGRGSPSCWRSSTTSRARTSLSRHR